MREAMLLLLLLAGCVDTSDNVADPEPEPTANDPGGPGDPQEPTRDPETGEILAQESWFLHNEITCSEEPCNCGFQRFYMDKEDTDGDCDARGERSVFPDESQECKTACYPAEAEMAKFPAGTTVSGTIYITTDAVDEVDVHVALAQDVVLGQTSVYNVPVQGLGGATYEAVPFTFTLDEAVGNGTIEFQLGVDADVSYFIGYEDDHASRFTIG